MESHFRHRTAETGGKTVSIGLIQRDCGGFENKGIILMQRIFFFFFFRAHRIVFVDGGYLVQLGQSFLLAEGCVVG